MQEIIVYFLVAGAAWYIGRMLWQAVSGQAGCGGCGKSSKNSGCSSKKPAPGTDLIQISLNGTPHDARK